MIGSYFLTRLFFFGALLPLLLVYFIPTDGISLVETKKSATILSAAEISYPPYSEVNADGEATGFSVELLRAVLRQMGYRVDFVVSSWVEVMSALERGEVQVLPLVGRTPERDELFDFTVPYLREYGSIVVRKGTDDIRSLEDLRGKRVAVMKADNAEEFARRSDLGAHISTTQSFEQALSELSRGEHDAVIIQNRLASRLIRENNLHNLVFADNKLEAFRQDFCFAVRNDDEELLSLLNEGLSVVMTNGTFDRLLRKWFFPTDGDKSRIVVGGDHDYPPYEYLDKNGLPTGYNVALTRALAKIMGVNVDIRLGPWSEIRDGLSSGTIDITHGMFYSAERDKEFDFTQPHTVIDHVVIVRDDANAVPQSIEELRGKTIVVMRGDIMHEWAVEHGPAKRLILAKTQQEALRMLSSGDGDCALVARVPALYWIKKNKYDNLTIGPSPLLSPEYCYAALHEKKHLVARFANALETLHSTGEYRRIRDAWLGVYEESRKFETVLKYGAAASGLLAILLILSFYWSRSLKRQVAQRTKELSTSERRFRRLAELAPIGIILTDADLRLTFANDRWRRMTGFHEHDAPLDAWKSLISEEHREEFFEKLIDAHRPARPSTQAGGAVEIETRIHASDGKTRDIFWLMQGIYDEQGNGVGFVGATVDVTERRELETQLRQSEKMQAVGQLAGGIAHDLNNQLSVILGFADLLVLDLEDPTFKRHAERILTGGTRAKDLVKQLLTFGRKGMIQSVPVNLSEVLTEVIEMLERSIDKRIRIHRECTDEDLYLRGDPSQVQNMLLNLGINARDALPDGGTIMFRAQIAEVDEAAPPSLSELTPGRYVLIQVEDDGTGMKPEVVGRIFEPFFTTKEKGAGTGMGLASVYGSVKSHGGAVSVESRPGHGSVFSIYLPWSEPPKDAPVTSEPRQSRGGARVLIVDDEELVREIGKGMLERLGHKVATCSDGREAVSYFEKNHAEVDLVILDMEMPVMNGQETFEAMRKIDPDVRVIIASGHSFDESSHRRLSKEAAGILKKPYNIDELSKEVSAALE